MMMTVKPLASFLTVMRFSKEAMSCACRVRVMKEKQITKTSLRNKEIFIEIVQIKVKGYSRCFQIRGLSDTEVNGRLRRQDRYQQRPKVILPKTALRIIKVTIFYDRPGSTTCLSTRNCCKSSSILARPRPARPR